MGEVERQGQSDHAHLLYKGLQLCATFKRGSWSITGISICTYIRMLSNSFVDWLLTKHRRHAHYLPSMFSCCISLVSPSLARCQVNTVELGTNCFSLLMLTWLKSISAPDVMYDGEIVQHVTPQKLTAHTDIPT